MCMKHEKYGADIKAVAESLRTFSVICLSLIKEQKKEPPLVQIGELACAIDQLKEHIPSLFYHPQEDARHAARMIENVLESEIDISNSRYTLLHAVKSFKRTGNAQELVQMVRKWGEYPQQLEVLVDDLHLIRESLRQLDAA